MQDDPSIALPRFFEQPAIQVGGDNGPYELDGMTLQAIRIAANDHLPPDNKDRPCWQRQETQRYRVIRQGSIVFVHIEEDPEACGLQYIALDSGVTYAVSTDGRILRRVFGGSPEGALVPELPSEGQEQPMRPDTAPDAGMPRNESPPDVPSTEQDGGAGVVRPEPQ